MKERETLTVMETAAYLGLSRNSTYEAIRRNEIPHVHIGKRILVPRAALEQLLGAPAEGRSAGEASESDQADRDLTTTLRSNGR